MDTVITIFIGRLAGIISAAGGINQSRLYFLDMNGSDRGNIRDDSRVGKTGCRPRRGIVINIRNSLPQLIDMGFSNGGCSGCKGRVNPILGSHALALLSFGVDVRA